MYEKWFTQDLRENVTARHCESVVFEGDNNTYLVGVRVTDGGADAALSGTVSCKVIRPDNATVTFEGALSGNCLSAVLPRSALAYPGVIAVVLQLASGSNVQTFLKAGFTCERTTTDTIVDPGNVIPSLEELLAQLDAAETATSRANAAAAAVEGLTVEAHAASGSAPSAQVSEVSGHYHIDFGLVPASITSQVTTYQNSASGTTVPTGTWQSEQPSTPQGQFLWTRTVITWNNTQTTTVYSVSRQGKDGTGSVSTVNGISPDANDDVALPTDTTPTANSTNYVTSGGVRSAIDAVAARVSAAEGNIDAHGTRLTQAESDITAAQTAVGTLGDSVADMGTRVNNMETLLPALPKTEDITASAVLTKTGGSYTINAGTLGVYRCGDLVWLTFSFSATASVSGGSDIGTAQLSGVPLPAMIQEGASYRGNSVIFIMIDTDGIITLRNTGATLPGSGGATFTVMYMAAPEEEEETT